MRSLERHCFIHDVVQGGSQPGTLTSFLGPLLKPKSTVVKKKKEKKKVLITDELHYHAPIQRGVVTRYKRKPRNEDDGHGEAPDWPRVPFPSL